MFVLGGTEKYMQQCHVLVNEIFGVCAIRATKKSKMCKKEATDGDTTALKFFLAIVRLQEGSDVSMICKNCHYSS
jgi:hypothetical protein